jgi:hypothetical protein
LYKYDSLPIEGRSSFPWRETVNIPVVENAVGGLEKVLSEAKSALRQVEREVFGLASYGDKGGTYDYPLYAMEGHLLDLHDILLVVLEAADMPEARASLIENWKKFTSAKNGLRHTDDNGEYQSCESPTLTFLERLINGLRMTVTDEVSSEEAWTLARLEAMLRDTPGLLHRRKISPAKESDLQEVMHDYLSACFPDFVPAPQIGGTLKNFKPDCGIASVRAAIEFKIVHTKEQVAIAFSGVTEDTSGYKGSKDWTRFYAVVYQDEPFMLESHLRSDMKRIGAAMWKGFVVNAPTKKRAPKKSIKKKALRRKKAG